MSTQKQDNLKEKLMFLPDQPGIYQFKNSADQIIYIGKAKVLKNRVKSYFIKQKDRTLRLQELIIQIQDVSWIITQSESAALILEDKLIKLHKPKYNIRLKDQKSYPFLKLTQSELFPRLLFSRKIVNDGSAYFGPYDSAFDLKKTLRVINTYFHLRTSKMQLDDQKSYRPCINYQMKRCFAPCAQLITSTDYKQHVEKVKKLLRGDFQELIAQLELEMQRFSEALQFEDAAQIRDQIKAVKMTLKKNKRLYQKKINQDIFAIIRDQNVGGVQFSFIRNGLLMSSDFIFIKSIDQFSDEEVLRSVFSNMYIKNRTVLPSEIVVPIELSDDFKILATLLEETHQTKLHFITPKIGYKKQLLMNCYENGLNSLKLAVHYQKQNDDVLDEIQRKLHLKNRPERIECFDVSNIAGTHTVGSMVVMDNLTMKPDEYKRYKIKTVNQADDFASIFEMLTRRLQRAKSGELPLPNLMIIDGGKGQIERAQRAVDQINIENQHFDLIGLAKGRSAKKKQKKDAFFDFEYVVKPNQKNAILLQKQSSVLHSLQKIRDEAHRFAITYHRKVRTKYTLTSELEQIKNIGSSKRTALLKHFQSIERIKTSSIEELMEVKSINQGDAKNIFDFFRQNKN